MKLRTLSAIALVVSAVYASPSMAFGLPCVAANMGGPRGGCGVKRAAMVAAVSGKRGKRYLKRQQLLELGEPAIRYLTEIVHLRPRQWYEDVDRLHQILQSHGPEVLRRAMEEGLKQQIYGAFYVERSLQPGLRFPQGVQ